MSSTADRSGVARIAVSLPAVVAAVLCCAACSPKSPSAAPDAPEPPTCPSTAAEAIAASCSTEGYTCYPQYSCGISPAILKCVCTENSYACQDATGKLITAGTTPSCPAAAMNEMCPASELTANLLSCTKPGLLCAYPSTCGDPTLYDQCQCFEGALRNGQMGLRFECTTPCLYDSGPIEQDAAADTSVVQSQPEASIDARGSD
jgi:hypothetical protein